MSDQENDGAWFLPKRFGVGAGRPIAWQGWATVAIHGGLVALGIPLLHLAHQPTRHDHLAFVAYALTVTIVFLPIYAAKTRGGWKWRWWSKD